MDNFIGLKGFKEKYKGCGPIYKIKHLIRELRYAWQRAWRGFDDSDIYSMNDNFRERMLNILEVYKRGRDTNFGVPKETEHYEHLGKKVDNIDLRIFSTDETNMIIDSMIYHLKMMNEDYVEKKLFGNCVYDDVYITKSANDYCKIVDIINQNRKCFMKLFDLFYDELWD